MSETYVYLWEFIVPPDRLEEFQRHYGPDGPWVVLFRKAAGYIDSTLLHDRNDPNRFITIDRWVSRDAHDAFRRAFAREYADLDARCEQLTARESSLGEFTQASGRL